MTNGNGVDSSSDNDDVPKIVVDQEFIDEDRDPDEKTEELLKVRLGIILKPNFEVSGKVTLAEPASCKTF